MDEEKQLDDFLQESREQAQDKPKDAPVPTDEDVVEDKAREGKPQAGTILQNRSLLSDADLSKRIAETLRKHTDIDEAQLRKRIADKIDASDGDISEAEYQQIVNAVIKRQKLKAAIGPQVSGKGPIVQPPPLVGQTVAGAQQKVQSMADWAGSLATPGGLGFLIFTLLFFLWVIIPVSNGKTRMQLLWGVLTGQVKFSQTVTEAEANAGQDTTASTPPASNTGGGGSLITFTPLKPTFEVDEW